MSDIIIGNLPHPQTTLAPIGGQIFKMIFENVSILKVSFFLKKFLQKYCQILFFILKILKKNKQKRNFEIKKK